MSTEIEVKFRNGIPTQKALRALIDTFWKDHNYRPRLNQGYGSLGNWIVWEEYKKCNPRIDEFVSFLKSNGINIGTVTLAASPSTGSIQVIPTTN